MLLILVHCMESQVPKGNAAARWYPTLFAGNDLESGCLLSGAFCLSAKTFPTWGQAEHAEGAAV